MSGAHAHARTHTHACTHTCTCTQTYPVQLMGSCYSCGLNMLLCACVWVNARGRHLPTLPAPTRRPPPTLPAPTRRPPPTLPCYRKPDDETSVSQCHSESLRDRKLYYLKSPFYSQSSLFSVIFNFFRVRRWPNAFGNMKKIII